MPKLIRSARGQMVNFDLVLIKQEIAANAAPTNVSSREDFIENRIRRRTARRTGKLGVKPSERELGDEVSVKTIDEPEIVEQDEPAVTPVESTPDEPTPARRVKK